MRKMCYSTFNRKKGNDLEIPYISNVEEFIQHLFVVFYYLQQFPTHGDHADSYEGHIISFQDIDIIFYTS